MLEISRNNISADFLEDYSPHERFIKLPVGSYLQLNGIEPIRPQTALINALNSPNYRFITGVLSRRTGKTFIVNIIANLVLLYPGSEILIMAPNYRLAKISWDLQQSLLRKFQIETRMNNSKDRIITLENDNGNGEVSSLYVGSESQADSVVGRSYDLILFDEAALTKKGREIFEVQLRPTLDKKNSAGETISKAVFISTPRGTNWFYDFYLRGFDESYPDWATIRSDYKENHRLTNADIESARRAMSRAAFRQEYESRFEAQEGQIYFLPSECVLDSVPSNFVQEDVIMGMDLGFRDPTAIVVLLVGYFTEDLVISEQTLEAGTPVVIVVDEYLKAELSTDKHASKLKALIEKYDCELLFIDHSNAQVKNDLAYIYGIGSTKSNKSVEEGIAFVSNLIDNARFFVLSSCPEVQSTLNNYKWQSSSTMDGSKLTAEKPVHDKYSHMADAVRYAVFTYGYNLVS